MKVMIGNKVNSANQRFKKILYYYLYHRKYFEEQIKYLIQKKTSNTAFIIATGSSIKRQDLALLKGHDCFTISNAYLHKDIKTINPIAHGFAAFHKPMDRENYIKWLRQAEEILPNPTVIYTDYKNKELIEESFSEASRKVVYGLYDQLAKWLWPRYFTSLFLPPQTGPLLMLPLLISMGYSRICLLGCDHNTLRNFGYFIENFYPPEMDIRKHATDPSAWLDIVSELKSNIILFEQYQLYSEWSRKLNINIVNLSDDSWLQQFDFSTLEAELTWPS